MAEGVPLLNLLQPSEVRATPILESTFFLVFEILFGVTQFYSFDLTELLAG